MKPLKILISSCLLGKKCSYDGDSRISEDVIDLCRPYEFVDLCPEMCGGLGCPRDKHEISGGAGKDVLEGKASVKSEDGKDHTAYFIAGAEKVLEEALKEDIKIAIMKARSPSCGTGSIYSGNFSGNTIEGDGVTAALLEKNGIKVFTEEELDKVQEFFRN